MGLLADSGELDKWEIIKGIIIEEYFNKINTSEESDGGMIDMFFSVAIDVF